MKIAILQIDIAWKDKRRNLEKTKKFASIAKDSNSDLIVLPETFTTGFCMDPELAEERGGETERFLLNLASSYKINIIAGYFLKVDNQPRNVAQVLSREGNLAGIYEKIHLFSVLGEDKVFKAGCKPIIFKINETPCTVFICYDLRFPEVFRTVSSFVDIIFVIANWPHSRIHHWLSLLKARAIENLCYVVGVNRVGKDGNGIEYSGQSVVYDPWGELILRCDNKEGVFLCDLDINRVLEIRDRYPFLRDKKINLEFQENLV